MSTRNICPEMSHKENEVLVNRTTFCQLILSAAQPRRAQVTVAQKGRENPGEGFHWNQASTIAAQSSILFWKEQTWSAVGTSQTEASTAAAPVLLCHSPISMNGGVPAPALWASPEELIHRYRAMKSVMCNHNSTTRILLSDWNRCFVTRQRKPPFVGPQSHTTVLIRPGE